MNISGSNSRPWLPFELIVRLRPLFVLQNHITWIKSITTPLESVGHFKPLAGKRFLNHNHEHIFHLTLSGDVQLDRLAIGVPFKDKSNIARRGHAQDARCRGNTWFIPYRTVQTKAEKYNHPGTFPLDLPRWCIGLHGRPDCVVLDPFAGRARPCWRRRSTGMSAWAWNWMQLMWRSRLSGWRKAHKNRKPFFFEKKEAKNFCFLGWVRKLAARGSAVLYVAMEQRPSDRLLILDFGSQVTQLIARRLREAGVYCEIYPFSADPARIAAFAPRGLILSGGPASVDDDGAPLPTLASTPWGCPSLASATGSNCW